ncbi:MAG: DUF1343 domain-containing protein [Clostridia bacterium]|nr:DUF1343 domain-containing protein [Clostridia bacterium]
MTTRCGIDRIDEFSHALSGKRLGLVTGGSGVGRDFRASIEILKERYDLTALLAPEHGIRGEQQGGVEIKGYTDAHSGLPVYSLFADAIDTTVSSPASRLYMPPKEALDRVDAIVMDIQDVGCRYYTYPSTLFYVMKACAAAGKECIVLDRPNPIGGAVEGNTHREENLSFIGLTRVPIRHGMTLGELGRFYQGAYGLDCQLTVIPVDGWNRSMFFDETGLPRICPSPNLPNLDAMTLYCGTCMLAGANVSDARGTTRPFEMIGAPYIEPFVLKEALDALRLPGLAFSAAWFIPSFFKYAGQVCAGVQIHVLDKRAVRPVALGVYLIDAIRRLWPGDFAFKEPQPGGRYHIDMESGTDEVRLGRKSPEDILAGWEREAEAFLPIRERYGLYE